MIDFHCHLDLYPDPVAVADVCRERKLYVLSVTTTPSAWERSRSLAKTGDRIRTALGLHPQIAHERKGELGLFDQLLLDTRYVGEIGLDGAPEFSDHWSVQLDVFTHVLDACQRRGGRVLSIHSRRAAKAVLECLATHPGCGTPVLHWFSGSARELKTAIQLGCWFSVGPAMLRSERGRALAAQMPRDRLLTETDGPFAQVGGQALLPWDVEEAVSSLASLWNESADQVHAALRDNLRRLGSGLTTVSG